MCVRPSPFLDPPGQEQILLIVPDGSPAGEVLGIFNPESYRLQRATCVQEAAALLSQSATPVVICAESLPDGDWRDVLELGAGLRQPPQMIVMAVTSGGGLYAEVLQRGGFEVLYSPWDCERFRHSVGVAARRWRSEAVREEMRQQRAFFDEESSGEEDSPLEDD